MNSHHVVTLRSNHLKFNLDSQLFEGVVVIVKQSFRASQEMCKRWCTAALSGKNTIAMWRLRPLQEAVYSCDLWPWPHFYVYASQRRTHAHCLEEWPRCWCQRGCEDKCVCQDGENGISRDTELFFSEYIVCKTVKFFNKSQVLHNKTLFRVNCVSWIHPLRMLWHNFPVWPHCVPKIGINCMSTAQNAILIKAPWQTNWAFPLTAAVPFG